MGLETSRLGSIFGAVLFAYSASVQFDDIDWYFWIPLYASASLIGFVHALTPKKCLLWIVFTLLSGLMLFFKVILEAIKSGTLLSMDMTQKVVREKWGSFLVVYAMALQLQRAVNTGTSCDGAIWIGAIWMFIIVSIGLCLSYFYS